MTTKPPKPLPPARLEDAVALAQSVGWPDGLAEWNALAATATILSLRDDDDRLIAMGALSDFGAVCVVGKMIVREDHRDRGLARLILRRLLEQVEPGVVVALSATDQGKPLYEKLGFREVDIVHIHRGTITEVPENEAIRAIVGDELGLACALDREASGCDRSKLFEARRALAAAKTMRHRDDGFGMVTEHGAISLVGPVVAKHEAHAAALVRALAATRPITRIDSLGSHPRFRATLDSLGLRGVGTRTLMTKDGRDLPGDRSLLFSLAGQAYG